MKKYHVIVKNNTNQQKLDCYTKSFDTPADAEQYFVTLTNNKEIKNLDVNVLLNKEGEGLPLKYATLYSPYIH